MIESLEPNAGKERPALNPEHLREQIKPLTFPLEAQGLSSSMSPDINEYLDFYGIHFEALFPDVRHYLGSIDSCGYSISCHLFEKQDAKGTFFLLHGYYDHVGLYSRIIQFLLEQGFNVLAYDLPGHGLSSGKPATIPDFSIYTLVLEDILTHCQGQLPQPWHAYGQSTGCAILTDCLITREAHQKPTPFQKVVLSAPLVRPWMWNLGRLQLKLAKFFITQLPRNYTENSRKKSFLELSHNDPLSPDILPTQWVLAMDRWIRRIETSKTQSPVSPFIVQGTFDRTVDAKHNIPMLEKLYTEPSVYYLEDARHHLPNELDDTIDDYLNWLTKKLAE
ncbi:alpha/beta hydrolase [Endozoicomonas arenosclerae]|uniref:alpha/beta hydrolase n=1 Tax=Endozoicomonas arenosclerae TaxID=1633495 RepID=UPI000781FEAA|nr:alpha/beta hydrolase [Endozoicomonas arenosclerae]